MKAEMPSCNLPRLLYAGDVPVQASTSGALLLHRLLSGYPTGRLSIAEGDGLPKETDRRLPGVEYSTISSYFWPRLARTRLQSVWRTSHLLAALGTPWLVRQIETLARAHGAQAILTVAHGHLWLAAVRAARRLRLPLHLIVHDDPAGTASIPRRLTVLRWHSFGKAYRRAASRLCISPGMVEAYEKEFGSPGTVLYPCCGEDSPDPRLRTGRHRAEGTPFVVAYAGTLWLPGYQRLVRALAEALGPLGGQMELYTPAGTADSLHGRGKSAENIKFRRFLPPAQLADSIADSGAVALFCPASFEADERATIETLFPSKLADYSVMGLPILIWGPEYSSATRWARERPGAAAVHTHDQIDADLIRLLIRLRDDADQRETLARGALAAGERDFSLGSSRGTLYRALRLAASRA